MDSQINNYDISIITKYVNAKKIAYIFYKDFANLDETGKMHYLKNICDELKEVKPDFYDEFVENIIINTLLYPNDIYLLKNAGTNALINDVDKILDDTNIGIGMLRVKSREFQLFNFSGLIDNGNFDVINFDSFPVKVDDFCKKFINGNVSIMEKNKNK